MEKEQFIGPKKILGVSVFDGKKTPSGEDILIVLYEDNTKEIMPKKRFDIVVTEEISDFTKSAEKYRKTVSSTIYSVLHEFGLKFDEIDIVLDDVTKIANSGLSKAYNIKFGIEGREELTLLQVNDVLMENYERSKTTDESIDGITPTGSSNDSSDTE